MVTTQDNITTISMDIDKFYEYSYRLAGAATGPLLADNPGYIFPSERVIERVQNIMKDFEVPDADNYGKPRI